MISVLFLIFSNNNMLLYTPRTFLCEYFAKLKQSYPRTPLIQSLQEVSQHPISLFIVALLMLLTVIAIYACQLVHTFLPIAPLNH